MAISTLNEIVNVTFTEKEIININLDVIDVLSYVQRNVISGLVKEIPVKLTTKRFRTSQEYTTGSLSVYFNGLKISFANVTEIDSTTFKITDATITGDEIEVEYVRKIINV